MYTQNAAAKLATSGLAWFDGGVNMCLVVINGRVAAECSATTKGAFCHFGVWYTYDWEAITK